MLHPNGACVVAATNAAGRVASVVAAEAESVVATGEVKAKGPGLFDMLTRLYLADRYLQKMEREEIDLGTLQETLAICGRPALLQSLESAGVDKAGPRDKIANYLTFGLTTGKEPFFKSPYDKPI